MNVRARRRAAPRRARSISFTRGPKYTEAQRRDFGPNPIHGNSPGNRVSNVSNGNSSLAMSSTPRAPETAATS